MDRRNFVKQSCTLCLATGAGMMVGSLSSCATLPVYKTTMANNKVTVPVSLFAQSDFQVIQPKDLFYNIGLQKKKTVLTRHYCSGVPMLITSWCQQATGLNATCMEVLLIKKAR